MSNTKKLDCLQSIHTFIMNLLELLIRPTTLGFRNFSFMQKKARITALALCLRLYLSSSYGNINIEYFF